MPLVLQARCNDSVLYFKIRKSEYGLANHILLRIWESIKTQPRHVTTSVFSSILRRFVLSMRYSRSVNFRYLSRLLDKQRTYKPSNGCLSEAINPPEILMFLSTSKHYHESSSVSFTLRTVTGPFLLRHSFSSSRLRLAILLALLGDVIIVPVDAPVFFAIS